MYPHITKDPKVCSGRPCVAGTRVRVMDIVTFHQQGMTPEEMVEQLPSIKSTVDVYAALLYYADHKEGVEAAFAEDAKLSEQTERELLERRRP